MSGGLYSHPAAHVDRPASIDLCSMAGRHMVAVPEPQAEAARLHAWAVTLSGPDWSSMVPPPKHNPQHLPLVVLIVHHDRCPEGTTLDPQRSQPPPESNDPISPRHLIGRRTNGQGMPHSTRLPVWPGSCYSTHGQTPHPNSASAVPQPPSIAQSPWGVGNFL